MIDWTILPVAQEELEEAMEHYLSIDPVLALEFERHFLRHLGLIRANPLMRRIRRFAVRYSHLTPQFHEHFIAYIVRAGQIVILAIGHSKRKPRPWQERMRVSRPPRPTTVEHGPGK